MNWEMVLTAMISASIPGVIIYLTTKGKTRADVAASLIETSMKLSSKFESRVATLEAEVCDLNRKIGAYQRNQHKLIKGVEKLVEQIETSGQKPTWTLDEETLEEVEHKGVS